MAHVKIGSAVGRQPARNSIDDQRRLIGLLHRVLAEDGGPIGIIPEPQNLGIASGELIAAILKFQRKNVPLRYQDGRVDPHGFTLGKLNELARNFFPVDPLSFPPDIVFPPPPPKPVTPPPPPTPAILRGLGLTMTNWKFEGSASLSFSVGPTGASLARFFISKDGDTEPHLFDFAGVTLGKGPLPAGLNIAPSWAPSTGTRIVARRPIVEYDDFKGECAVIALSVSPGMPAGGSGALVLFGARVSKDPTSIRNALTSAGAMGILVGTFVGIDIGGSFAAGAVA